MEALFRYEHAWCTVEICKSMQNTTAARLLHRVLSKKWYIFGRKWLSYDQKIFGNVGSKMKARSRNKIRKLSKLNIMAITTEQSSSRPHNSGCITSNHHSNAICLISLSLRIFHPLLHLVFVDI